uniref:Myotubularin phosphatase domain-containing protein n=1 Tax=Megaselia scalaris TaxID=36166 RepID=T1GCB6_MEGSC
MEFADFILTPKLDGVIFHDHLHTTIIDGTLMISGHHLIFSTRQEGEKELWLLHKNIDAIDKKPCILNNNVVGGLIILKCKDLRLKAVGTLPQEYPFFYRPMYSILEDGFTMFSIESEFSKLLTTDWRVSTVNKDFTVCPTYAATLVVPKLISDEQLVQSAGFRDGGRFPILSYRHENGSILLRSAQPLSTRPRCRADEAILNGVLGRSSKGFIVDTWGKGKSNSEADINYSQWKKINRSIGNISNPGNILDSLTKLVDACSDTHCSSDKWLSRLESSGWLGLVLNSLNAACVVAQCLDQEGSPVLVHGGKGLDSTLIITSLAQIILNPDCRTVRGLQALIEREEDFWCYISVVPGLYLPTILSIPMQFRVNTSLLIQLFEHSYSSNFGTFLGNCELDRHNHKVKKLTISLWSYLNRPDILKNFLNPLYEPNSNVIWPSVAPISLELWSELYLRWVIGPQNGNITKDITEIVTHEKELRSQVLKLRKCAVDLSKQIPGVFTNGN